MQIELTEEGCTLDGKWKLVPVYADETMRDCGGSVLYGHPRSSAIECAKEDKFDCRADESVVVYEQMVMQSPKPEFEPQEYQLIGYGYEQEISELGSNENSCLIGEKDEFGRNVPIFIKSSIKNWCNFCGVTIGDEHLPVCGNK